MTNKIKKILNSSELLKLLKIDEESLGNIREELKVRVLKDSQLELEKFLMTKLVLAYARIDSDIKNMKADKDNLRDAILELSGCSPTDLKCGDYNLKVYESVRRKLEFNEEKFKAEHRVKYEAWKALEKIREKYIIVQESPNLSVRVSEIKF